MRASESCLQLIRESEGFRPKPYLCPAGLPTIGYGSTRYLNGRMVSLLDGWIGVEEAEWMLRLSLLIYEEAVSYNVRVPLTQNQFDALVDFTYNVGAGNFQKSTLLRKLNSGDYAGAAGEFGQWVYGSGRKLQGLVERREKERELFDS